MFSWYQQLIAESLVKKSKGILPLVSTMPKDNQSLMQFYYRDQIEPHARTKGKANFLIDFVATMKKLDTKILLLRLFVACLLPLSSMR